MRRTADWERPVCPGSDNPAKKNRTRRCDAPGIPREPAGKAGSVQVVDHLVNPKVRWSTSLRVYYYSQTTSFLLGSGPWRFTLPRTRARSGRPAQRHELKNRPFGGMPETETALVPVCVFPIYTGRKNRVNRFYPLLPESLQILATRSPAICYRFHASTLAESPSANWRPAGKFLPPRLWRTASSRTELPGSERDSAGARVGDPLHLRPAGKAEVRTGAAAQHLQLERQPDSAARPSPRLRGG